MNPFSHILALLVALSAAGAVQAQATGATPKPQEKAREAGPVYGPVLHPQAAQASPAAPAPAADASPQAQEERAAPAQQARQRQDEPDPSARPAPQPPQPEPGQKAQEPKKDPKAKPAPRRAGAQLRIEPTPRIAAPSAHPYGRVTAPPSAAPTPTAPSSVQIGTCQGNVCTDSKGTSYATGVGNAAVNSSGRLCTRNGTTMQCF